MAVRSTIRQGRELNLLARRLGGLFTSGTYRAESAGKEARRAVHCR